MQNPNSNIYFNKQVIFIFLFSGILLLSSCIEEKEHSTWFGEEHQTIYQFLEKNKDEYSSFYTLMKEGSLLSTLSAYNPYAEGYTLFLPTNEAIDNYIANSSVYENFESLKNDTSFVKQLIRYHTINEKYHSDEFPFGAPPEETLSGGRLSISFFTEEEDAVIEINHSAPVIQADYSMVNGYIHTISRVLERPLITGYDWIQGNYDFSIFAYAMRLCEIQSLLWMESYTILAENDSIFHKNGIYSIDDLTMYFAGSGRPYNDPENELNKFMSHHILYGEYYLNDFTWGSDEYWTLSGENLQINVGMEFKINPGKIDYGIIVNEDGDSINLDYISPIWSECNHNTSSGPVHTISEMLLEEPLFAR